ncbi:MAG TPA: ATP-dependent helicase [Candidatus Saccharimonadales bacterium]|nr:ATP-dependent helicase [Candidatus Saccharimonadales bacterium]
MQNTLNDAQQAAVTAKDGPVLIVAGPGTGKTKTLTARIMHLIATKQAKPEQILALTFTKKAAEEMRERVGVDGKRANIMTFHALCHQLLGGELVFVSEPARLQLIKKLSRPATLKGLSVRELGLQLSRAKNIADTDADVAKVLDLYNTALAAQGLVDFDDLLVRVKEMLQTDETVRGTVQALYTHILVDEFQDTNVLQYELLKLLRGNDNLFVIGDPEQSIYGFRGASGSIFGQFMADFPAHITVTLTTNYRSTPEVVRLSNAIAADAVDLQAATTVTGKVQTVQVLNEYSEANWVVREIQRAIGGADLQQAVSDDTRDAHRTLSDFAVLYRSRKAGLVVQKTLEASGLPYQVVGDGSPYDKPHLQALIALVQSAATNQLPQLEGFGIAEQKALQRLLADAAQIEPKVLGEKAVRMLGLELTPATQQFLNTLTGFTDVTQAAQYFDTLAEQGFYDPNADAITLLTIHASKGLEFSHVFLVGAEEGILPHTRADEAEEKRLFYVAATRAKHRLDIVHAKTRSAQPAALSRFAANLPAAVLPRKIDPHMIDDTRRAQKRAIKRSQQSLF